MDDRIDAFKEKLQQLIESESVGLGENLEEKIPAGPGVYRLLERGRSWDQSLYVGKSLNLRRRLIKDHVHGNQRRSSVRDELLDRGICQSEEQVTQYLTQDCAVQFIEIMDPHERARLAHFGLAVLQPMVEG